MILELHEFGVRRALLQPLPNLVRQPVDLEGFPTAVAIGIACAAVAALARRGEPSADLYIRCEPGRALDAVRLFMRESCGRQLRVAPVGRTLMFLASTI